MAQFEFPAEWNDIILLTGKFKSEPTKNKKGKQNKDKNSLVLASTCTV